MMTAVVLNAAAAGVAAGAAGAMAPAIRVLPLLPELAAAAWGGPWVSVPE